MKYFKKGAPYYYPLTKRTVQSLFTRVFTPFSRGMSSTLILKKGFGGGKAMTKFMVDHVDDLSETTDLSVGTDTHRYIYVDPDEITESTSEAYLKLLFESYEKEFKDVTKIERMGSLIDHLEKIIDEIEVVFVLRGINYLTFADSNLWGNIKSLWQPLSKVNFLFVIYEGGPIPLSDSRFDRIRPMLSQNIVRFDVLSKEDIEYSIDRWSYTLEYDFSERERLKIAQVSRGYPSLLKVCCFAAAKAKDPNGTEFKRDPAVQVALSGMTKRSDSKDNKGSSFLGPKEFAVFRLLEERKGEVVTKDDISEVMWPKDTEEHYSEAAIVRLIGRIREKCDRYGAMVRIRAIYGRGYVLEGGDRDKLT